MFGKFLCEAYQGLCLIPSYWSRSPESQPRAGSVPFKCVFQPLPALGPFLQSRGVVKQGEPIQAFSSCWLQTEVQTVSNVLSMQVPTVVSLVLLRSSLRCKSPFSLRANQSPNPPLPLPCCGAIPQGR